MVKHNATSSICHDQVDAPRALDRSALPDRRVGRVLAYAVWLILACLPSVVFAEVAMAPGPVISPRVAILTDTQATDHEPLEVFSDLFGIALQKCDGLTLLERDQFKAVLREITISQLVGADAISERLEASALLDADILLMVHYPLTRTDQVAVTMVDSRHGLRLAEYVLPADGSVEKDTHSLASVVSKRIHQAPQQFRLIVAVPPIVDARLVPEPAGLGLQLAESIRAIVSESPDVLVLEVDEARALSREMHLRGDDRLKSVPEPTFLIGRLITDSDGGVSVELRRENLAGQSDSRVFKADRLAGAVSACMAGVDEILRPKGDDPAQNGQDVSDAIIARLVSSANDLKETGDAYQARDLIETAILLNPDSPALYKLAIEYIGGQMSYVSRQPHSVISPTEKQQRWLELLRDGQTHRYAALKLILLGGNRELKDRKGRPELMERSYLAGSYCSLIQSLEFEHIYLDLEPGNQSIGDNLQRLYQLVMACTDEQLKDFRSASIAGLISYIRNIDPASQPDFAQRFALYQRLQNRGDADLAAMVLFSRPEGEQLRQQIAYVDQRLDQLSVHGLMAYETALMALMDSGALSDFFEGSPYRTPEMDAMLAGERERREKPPSPRDDPDVIFARPLDLRVADDPYEQGREIFAKGWFDAGLYGELIYDDWHVCLVTGPGRITTLLSVDPELRKEKNNGEKIWIARRLTRPCFDGRYVWIGLICDPGHLFVIDLKTREVSHFSEADGLFPMGGGVAVAAIGEGDVLVSASTSWDGRVARCWSARVQYAKEAGLSVNVIQQILPNARIDDAPVYGNIHNAVALPCPLNPSGKLVVVDYMQGLWLFDHSLKMVISPDTGEIHLLRWGKYETWGLGLAECFIYDGAIYYMHARDWDNKRADPIKRYDPATGKISNVRKAFMGHGIKGMTVYNDAYLAVDRRGDLWGSRDLMAPARRLGPLEPELDVAGMDEDRAETWRDVERYEFNNMHLFASRYYGLVGWYFSFEMSDNAQDHKSWVIELKPGALDSLDQADTEPRNVAVSDDPQKPNLHTDAAFEGTDDSYPGPTWMPMVKLPAGRFTMGNPDPDSPYARIEPLREVDVPEGVWMGMTEVTQAQWHHVMEGGPVPDGTPSLPVKAGDIPKFCKKLNQMTGLNYRLPTEAEWEYACRAGSETRYASGDSVDDLRRIGRCSYDGKIGTAGHYAFVGCFEPNAWGLYDMHGNFAEYTCSFLDKDGVTVHDDPTFHNVHRPYINRGGSWVDTPDRCRSASRRTRGSYTRYVGFRLVLDTRPD